VASEVVSLRDLTMLAMQHGDFMTDRVVEDAASKYDTAQSIGQSLISERWTKLRPGTRTLLVSAGFYSSRGESLAVEFSGGGRPADDCHRLEYSLGKLSQCARSALPYMSAKDALIPKEALDDDVLSSASEIVFVREWHDPEFLRVSLNALVRHQQATCLRLTGPLKEISTAWGCLGSLFKGGMVLLMPFALALALTGSFHGDTVSAAFAFYLFSAGLLAASSIIRGPSKKQSVELEHLRWNQVWLSGGAGLTGTSVLDALKRLSSEGVSVPAVIFDAAFALQHSSTTSEFSEVIKSPAFTAA
jgi:hypothetical protein